MNTLERMPKKKVPGGTTARLVKLTNEELAMWDELAQHAHLNRSAWLKNHLATEHRNLKRREKR